ncbi:hypothetical protein MW290_00860 [Aquincola tertiaricarbonis]|uniref:Flagellar assembly protein FliH/Type III secretion system HrpE domain-containing protein n=1 Tax=Aquincola tertiaricarbonis TaxID=391953 RepID=A0ABY4S448_AQUTE|nr:hypothetical protein [Aquincola tertiaricarbonis]URI07209.1 hypothetical protein MW290_00860 [Aquincola tertiaricarbonis]
MTAPGFIAVHRSALGSLSLGRAWLSADELTACHSATALLARLESLATRREAELQGARDAAHAQGLTEGRAEALRQAGPQLAEAWQQAADDAVLQAAELRQAAVALALQIVERITAELAPAEVVAALARRAAEALAPEQPAVLRLHPEVAQALSALPGLADGSRLQLRPDATLAPLDCVFDTPAGQLIAGLPQQLQRLGGQLQAAAAQEVA